MYLSCYKQKLFLVMCYKITPLGVSKRVRGEWVRIIDVPTILGFSEDWSRNCGTLEDKNFILHINVETVVHFTSHMTVSWENSWNACGLLRLDPLLRLISTILCYAKWLFSSSRLFVLEVGTRNLSQSDSLSFFHSFLGKFPHGKSFSTLV